MTLSRPTKAITTLIGRHTPRKAIVPVFILALPLLLLLAEWEWAKVIYTEIHYEYGLNLPVAILCSIVLTTLSLLVSPFVLASSIPDMVREMNRQLSLTEERSLSC